MAAHARGQLPKDLERARSRFQAWRRRKAGGPIPQPLWALAVRLVNTHGVSRTATALGLDYYSLKRRTATAAGEPDPTSPAFIELPSPPLLGKQCLLEVDNGAGATLRL